MQNIKSISPDFSHKPSKVAIVAAEFNSMIVEPLTQGAITTLVSNGVKESDITLIKVPGSFEIPVVAKRLLQKGEFDGVIALGAVIKGETAHFDHVAGQCASGLMSVSVEFAKPVIFGILTVDTVEQALNRAGLKLGNKGSEAALTLLQTHSVLSQASL